MRGLASAMSDAQGVLFADQPRSFPLPLQAADRIGVVDVGSNSVRMVVFEGGRRCPAMIFNEKVQCGLGADLERTGRLAPDGIARAMAALNRFVDLAPHLHVGALAGVATAAVREAADGPAFRDRVEAETGIRLEIASGEEEAELAALGVLFGDPAAEGVVVDLGGASLEICPVAEGRPGQGISTPLGPQRLGPIDKPTKTRTLIDRVLKPLRPRFAPVARRLYLVGGAWRAFGRVQIDRAEHPLNVLHEYTFSPAAARQTAAMILKATPDKLKAQGVPSGRLDSVPYAALLLPALIDCFEPEEVVLSGFGLREGVCYRYLPPPVRAEDPLLSTACGHERTRARDPGFGAELADWLMPVLGDLPAATRRLIRAACHLADVAWRAHPDYRAIACLDVVTRVNLSSAGHPGRVFLMVSLLNRYKGGRKATDDSAVAQDLLGEDARVLAARVGGLMRLGCTLAGAHRGILPRCPLGRTDDTLILSPMDEVRSLMGEEVESRLRAAARGMDLGWAIA